MHSKDYPRLSKILVKSSHPVAVALRRYVYSYDRYLVEDRLVDLAIALEALFADGNTEVSYRVSANGANFVTVPRLSRRQVRDWIKAAYDVRSKVVHGNGSNAVPTTRLLRDDQTGVEGLAAESRIDSSVAICVSLSASAFLPIDHLRPSSPWLVTFRGAAV